MPSGSNELHWVPEQVKELMHSKGIKDRSELAKLRIGVGQTTIYRSFDKSWAGRVQVKMLTALVHWTGLPLVELVANLIVDPLRGRAPHD